DGLSHGSWCERVSLLHQRDQFLEHPPDALGFLVRAGDRDLVAADDDLGVERGFDQLEQLVSLAEEGNHGLVAWDEDLDLGGGSRQVRLPGAELPSSCKRSSIRGRCRAEPEGCHPGGHPIGRPPSRYTCRWCTV